MSSESGSLRPPGGAKRSRSAASWRQRSAVDKPSAIFQTVSEDEFSEVRIRRVLRASLPKQTDPHQAALKNTMADAPTTTTTKTSITMAGSSTTRSALPVLVECISRIPTVAR
jgi:hypothetical protein